MNHQKIGYARVSTADQNLERQLDLLRQYGVELVFQEKMTGTKRDRPELNRLLAHVAQGDTVVVESLSRLGRSTKDLIELVELLKGKGVQLGSLKEQIDTSTPTGTLLFKLHLQEQSYQQLVKAIRQYGDSAFPRLVHQWLGQPDAYDEQNWIGESACKIAERQLQELIDKYNGVSFSHESKQQEFSQELAACYFVISGKNKRIDRNNGKYGLVQLNHMLNELKIRGKIDKIGKKGSEAWILQIAHDTCLRSETGGGCGKQDDHSGGESLES